MNKSRYLNDETGGSETGGSETGGSEILDEFDNFINLKDTKDNYETQQKVNHFIINTKDRNAYIDTNYDFSLCVSSFNTNSSINNLTINKDIKNIVSIELLHMIIPNIYIDIEETLNLYSNGIITNEIVTETINNSNNIRLDRISDLPYLLLNISEFNNTLYGTNNAINKSTFILKLDDSQDKTNNSGDYMINANNKYVEYGNLNKSFLANTDRKSLFYKDFNGKIDFYSSRKNCIQNLRFSITTPLGEPLQNINNYLEIESIIVNQTSSVNTTLNGAINSIVIAIVLASVSGFPTTGTNFIQIGSEILSYTGINTNTNTLTGVKRGRKNTIESSHLNGSTIELLADNYNLIEIKTKKYFCADEYNLGDRLLFRDIKLNSNSNVNIIDLQDFLMREKGHTILKLSNTPTNNRRLFNQLFIPYEFIYNSNNGTSSIKTNFSLNIQQHTVSIDTSRQNSNIAINLSLQTSISLNIVNEERTHSFLHTNII